MSRVWCDPHVSGPVAAGRFRGLEGQSGPAPFAAPSGGLLGYRAVVYVRRGSVPTARWETLVWSGMAGVLLLWGVWRNIV